MVERATLSDVARLAGVHKGTASRALNEATRDLVLPATARRVQAAARQLGYAPNTFAQGLRRQKSRTVGVLIPDLTNPFFPPIVRGIDDALAEQGFVALLASTDNDQIRERRLFESLVARQADGYIIATAMRDHPLLHEAHAQGARAVLVQRSTDTQLFPAVLGDDSSGVEQVIAHLVGLGHRRIAHVAAPQTTSTGFRRARAFRESAADAGLPIADTPTVVGDYLSIEAGAAATREILERYPDVTAIFAANDLMAVGALRALRAAGLSCPQDVSVVGFNDMALAADLAPGLTTIRVPLLDVGRQAAQMLLAELAEPSTPRQVLMPVQLVPRESSAGPRAGPVRGGRRSTGRKAAVR